MDGKMPVEEGDLLKIFLLGTFCEEGKEVPIFLLGTFCERSGILEHTSAPIHCLNRCRSIALLLYIKRSARGRTNCEFYLFRIRLETADVRGWPMVMLGQ